MTSKKEATEKLAKEMTGICAEVTELVTYLEEHGASRVDEMSQIVANCLERGGTVFACGNGGSAAQAEHFAGELMGRFGMERRALPVFALTENTPVLTAIANDTSYERVFSRQIEGLGKPGDCLIALTTSGESKNVVQACRAARQKGMKVLALLGTSGTVLELSDIALRVPGSSAARIQEIHLVALHAICQAVEQRLFGA